MRKGTQLPFITIMLGVLTLILGVSVTVLAQEAPGCTIWVQPGESIQAAIDTATEGTVICLAEGTWAENVVISKSITLIGQGSSLSIVESLDSCLPVLHVTSSDSVSAVHVRVEGLGVLGAYGYWCAGPPAVGVLMDGTATAVFVSCEIAMNADSGILLTDSAEALVNDCLIAENDLHGIHATDTASAAIEGTTIRESYYNGIFAEDASSIHVERSTINNNYDAGIWCTSSRQVEGIGNTFSGNGIALVGNVGSDVRTVSADAGNQQIIYPHADYASLQEAVDSVAAGGEIILQDGTYWESIVVSREISIKAGAEATLNSSSEWIPVVSLVEGGHLHLTDVGVHGGIIGVVAGADSKLVGTRCSFVDNDDVGILAQDSAEVILSECEISWNGWNGIKAHDSAALRLSDCTVAYNYSDGLVMAQIAVAYVNDCEIYGNTCGIRTEDAVTLDLNGSTISENYDCGIISEGGANTFRGRDNVIAGNGSDLVGSIPWSITLSSREPTELEIVFPNPAYDGLQDAVDALLPDGRLILKEGLYEGNLVVWRDLWIEPVGGASVEITGASASMPTIDLIEGASLHLSSLTVSGGKDGIRASGSSSLAATDVTVSGSLGSAINLLSEASATLTNCLLTDSNGGLYVSDSSHAETVDATIRFNSQLGISVSSNASVTGTGIVLYANGTDVDGNLHTDVLIKSLEESAAMLFPNTNYSTLQEAIDALPEGGELVLQGGSHEAGVTINKLMSLRAQLGKNVDLVGTNEGLPVIALGAGANVSLIGLFIRNAGEGVRAEADSRLFMTRCDLSNLEKALTLVDTANATITNCNIKDNAAGIEIRDESYLSLSGSTIQRTDGDGLSLYGESTAEVSYCEISDNTTGVDDTHWLYSTYALRRWNGCGIRTYDSSRLYLEQTELTSNGHGLDVTGDSHTTVVLCTFSGNDVDGVSAWDSAHIKLVDCLIEDCGEIGDGIYLVGSATADIEGCTVRRNGASALHTTDTSQASVRGCDFSENGISGVSLEGESSVVALDVTVRDHERASITLSGSSGLEMRQCAISKSPYGVFSTEFSGGVLYDTMLCDISSIALFSISDHMFEGTENRFERNGLDLKGNVSGELRTPLSSPTATEIVYPDQSFESLQAALDGLLPEGTLWIREGNYEVGLTITGNASVRAFPGDIVTLMPSSDDITVLSLTPGAFLLLSGIQVRGGMESVYSYSAQIEIVDCAVSDSSTHGLVLDGSSQLSMETSTISNCGEYGLAVVDNAQALVSRSFIHANDTGLFTSDLAKLVVEYCSVSSNTVNGMSASGEAEVTISNCFLLENSTGVLVNAAARVTLQENTIARSTESAVLSFSTQPVEGSRNLLLANGNDLTGALDPLLRIHLLPATEREIVYPSEPYGSIQEALDALLPEGRLLLQNGIYQESLTISKSVKIMPVDEEGNVELRGEEGEGAIAMFSLIPGADLALSGVTLAGGYISIWAASDSKLTMGSCVVKDFELGGVWILDSAQAVIDRCILDDAGETAVLLTDSSSATIADCVIRNATQNAILIAENASASIVRTSLLGSESSGAAMGTSAIAIFEECVFRYNKNGLEVNGQADVTLKGCSINENVEYALVQTSGASSTWTDSLVLANGLGGVSVSGTGHVDMANCQLNDNDGAAISLSGETQGIVKHCSISGSHSDGIRVSGTSILELDGSTVADSLLSGLYLLDESQAALTDCEINLNVHGIEMADSAQCHIYASEIQQNRYSAIDLSDSSQATAAGSWLSENTLGIRLRDSATVEMTDCHVLNNTTGMLFLDTTEGICLSSEIQGNAFDGIALWDSAEVSLQTSDVSGNGRIDLSVCSIPKHVSEVSELEQVVTACGVPQQYPQDPPADVLDVKESVVHVDIYATEPGFDKLLWLDANGVIIEPGSVLTCWHLFMGEEDISQLVEISTLLVEDPDDYTVFMNTADLAGMLMNREYDLATLLTDRKLAPALSVVVQAPPPQDIVWYVGNLDGDWYIIPGIVTFPERSCIEAFLPYVSRDHIHDDPRLLARHYLPDAYATLRDDTQSGLSGGAVVTQDGKLIGILGPKPCGTDRTAGIWSATRAYDGEESSL